MAALNSLLTPMMSKFSDSNQEFIQRRTPTADMSD